MTSEVVRSDDAHQLMLQKSLAERVEATKHQLNPDTTKEAVCHKLWTEDPKERNVLRGVN